MSLLRNTEIPGIFRFIFQNLLFLYVLWTREVKRGLWPLLTNILVSPQAGIPGKGWKRHITLASNHCTNPGVTSLKNHIKENCRGAKIFSCDSQAPCKFPNKAMTLKSMSFQSLIDFQCLLKKHIVYMSGCADIQTGWDGHSSLVSKPGFQKEWTK